MTLEDKVRVLQDRGPKFSSEQERKQFEEKMQYIQELKEKGLVRKRTYNLAMSGTLCNTY